MLSHLSWQQYFEALLVLLTIYYTFVALKFYVPELSRKSARKVQAANQLTELQYPEALPDAGESLPDETTNEAEKLIAALKECIGAETGQPIALGQLEPNIKRIFQRYPSLKDSALRPAINELVVTEGEKTGITTLTEEQVDEWWR